MNSQYSFRHWFWIFFSSLFFLLFAPLDFYLFVISTSLFVILFYFVRMDMRSLLLAQQSIYSAPGRDTFFFFLLSFSFVHPPHNSIVCPMRMNLVNDGDGGILQSLCKLKINSEMQKTMIPTKANLFSDVIFFFKLLNQVLWNLSVIGCLFVLYLYIWFIAPAKFNVLFIMRCMLMHTLIILISSNFFLNRFHRFLIKMKLRYVTCEHNELRIINKRERKKNTSTTENEVFVSLMRRFFMMMATTMTIFLENNVIVQTNSISIEWCFFFSINS